MNTSSKSQLITTCRKIKIEYKLLCDLFSVSPLTAMLHLRVLGFSHLPNAIYPLPVLAFALT